MNDSSLDSSPIEIYDDEYNEYNEYPNDVPKQYGLRDKYDQGSGLSQNNPNNIQITTTEYTVTVDTRDCVGRQSLIDAQTVAEFNGTRPDANGTIVSITGLNISPIVVTLTSIDKLKSGDEITISEVNGNTNANGIFRISNITTTSGTTGTVTLYGTIGNAAYTGGGKWSRSADKGYPKVDNRTSIIEGNQIIVNMHRPLKNIRTLSLFNINIPRDIIPLEVYITDFIEVSIRNTTTDYPGVTESNYTTMIPQEATYMESRLLGFYSSPIDLWRTYIRGSMSLPDQVTASPLQLWNPPLGSWPLQPIPYPFQTVPTYVSDNFSIENETGLFHLILSGYGVYDLLDWSVNTGSPIIDSFNTSLMRKLLLFLIVPKQSYRDQDYINLIINCKTVDDDDLTFPFGYGSFQRFVPGPGYQQNYQPGTNTAFPGNPTEASSDSPVPFPHFRGNVCGPYNNPGDRFQKLGIRTLVQDLYLNGDLNNLFGDPIILPDVPVDGIPNDPSFGLNFLSLIEVNLGNISTTTNLNILNAMRISPNGFGATIVRANGSGNTYTNPYQNAGGQGPSLSSGSWVNRGIYSEDGSLDDPIAQGPYATNVTGNSADASTTDINHETAYFDLGAENGSFIRNILKYIDFAVNDIPDTDLIIKIQEAERTIRSQSTNGLTGDALLDVPIRLSLGSTNGTQQYIESVPSLVSGASYYWEQRYKTPLGQLQQLHLKFYTYNGDVIPLERMLQQRRSLELLRLTVRIINDLEFENNPFNITYLFDPLNPKLLGRVKRYFQIIFKITCYEGIGPGLDVSTYAGIPPYTYNNETRNNFS